MAIDLSYYKRYEPIDGKWYIGKELGRGAYGIVFEVFRKDFCEIKSAMKAVTIPSSNQELHNFRLAHPDWSENKIEAFYRSYINDIVQEFQIMSKLKGHSNIVCYEDHNVYQHPDTIGWDIFIRMELLTPAPLDFSSNSYSQNDVIKLGIDICKALEICSKHNIIHQDIKPANIFISDTGDYKLGDFGLAQSIFQVFQSSSVKGTYSYMAPEVYKKQSYNSSIDTYSLGIVLYKMMNNSLDPFCISKDYDNVEQGFIKRMSGYPLPSPSNASNEFSKIILKACSFSPDDRYKSPQDMRIELEKISKCESLVINSDDKLVSTPVSTLRGDLAHAKKTSSPNKPKNSFLKRASDLDDELLPSYNIISDKIIPPDFISYHSEETIDD